MKKVLAVLVITFLVVMVLACYPPSIGGYAYADTDTSSVIHLTKDGSSEIANVHNMRVVRAEELMSFNLGSAHIIVDSELLDVESVMRQILGAYDSGSRVIVTGASLTRNNVEAYFGLEESHYQQVKRDPGPLTEKGMQGQPVEGHSIDVSQFDSFGVLIYKQGDIVNLTQIYIESPEQISRALERCLSYDYLNLAPEARYQTILSSGYTSSWNFVKVATNTYVTSRGVIYTSLRLLKNAGNPSNGQHLFYVPYIVEVEMDSPLYFVDKTEIDVGGGLGSLVVDYGPLPVTTSGSISFSLPWGVSGQFDPRARVRVSKVSGGINSRWVTLEYDVRTPLGFSDYARQMRCEAHILSYQTSSLLEGAGGFRVRTVMLNHIQPIIYNLPILDMVSGY